MTSKPSRSRGLRRKRTGGDLRRKSGIEPESGPVRQPGAFLRRVEGHDRRGRATIGRTGKACRA